MHSKRFSMLIKCKNISVVTIKPDVDICHGAVAKNRYSPSSMSKKASQSFASADAKAVSYVFCRDMCVAENTLRGVSVELSAISGQQRRRTKRFLLEKVAKPLFRQSHGAVAKNRYSPSV